MAALLRAIGTLTLALPAILVSGCAGTLCEEWGTRVESVRVCGPKGTNCTYQDQPVRYCARKSSERAAPGGKEAGASALRPKEGPQTRAPEKIAKPAPVPKIGKPLRERFIARGGSITPDLEHDGLYRIRYSQDNSAVDAG